MLDNPPSRPTGTPIRSAMLRLQHALTGHPKIMVYYGSATEGATCKCGTHWGPADMHV